MNSAFSNIRFTIGAVDRVRYGVLFAACIIVLVGMIWMVRHIVCYNSIGGRGAWRYESFANDADARLAAIQQRLDGVRRVRETLDDDLEAIGIAGDDTCNILKEIEERYVGSAAAPSDESEFALPPETRQRREAERRTRAQARFKEEQRVYAALHGSEGVLECFAGNGGATEEDVAAAEDALAAELEDLTTLLDNSEIQLALQKGRKIQSLLGFNAKYLQRGLESTRPKTATEGFLTQVRGGALLAQADDLLGKAATIHNQLDAVKAAVAQQQRAAAELNRTTARVASGNISESDLRIAMMSKT